MSGVRPSGHPYHMIDFSPLFPLACCPQTTKQPQLPQKQAIFPYWRLRSTGWPHFVTTKPMPPPSFPAPDSKICPNWGKNPPADLRERGKCARFNLSPRLAGENPEGTIEMEKIEIYGHTVDFLTLPQASQMAIVRRGLVHLLGNEQASKVVVRVKKAEADGQKVSEEAKTVWKQEFVDAALASLLAGTVGSGVRAPAIDPVEAAMEKIATREVKLALVANGLKVPGTKGIARDAEIAFGDGTTRTLDYLIERWLAKHGEAARKEAEKAVRAAQKLAKEKAAKVEGLKADGPVTAESLGF
jgi:hypothetical protein